MVASAEKSIIEAKLGGYSKQSPGEIWRFPSWSRQVRMAGVVLMHIQPSSRCGVDDRAGESEVGSLLGCGVVGVGGGVVGVGGGVVGVCGDGVGVGSNIGGRGVGSLVAELPGKASSPKTSVNATAAAFMLPARCC